MKCRLWILGLLISASSLITPSASAQRPNSPGSFANQERSTPWLVTVMHQVRVDQLIADFSERGWRVSIPEDIATDFPSIANVTTGIVMDRTGQVLTRLVNANERTRASDITVTTCDGKTLHPSSLGFDGTSGYTVLRIPELNIEPPQFAQGWTVAGRGQRVRLLYNEPTRIDLLWRNVVRAAAASKNAAAKTGKVVQQRVPYLRTKKRVDSTWVTDPETSESTGSSAPAAARPRSMRTIANGAENPKHFRTLEVASLTPETDGSVVVNNAGQVVGLAQFVSPDKGVLRSIEELRALMDRLGAEHTNLVRGWLGVRLAEASNLMLQQAASLKTPVSGKVVIKDVIEGSPAAQAGLKANDMLLRFNEKPLQAPSELAELITRLAIGVEVPIEIWRDGTVQTINVSLAPRPDLEVSERREKIKRIEDASAPPPPPPEPGRNKFSAAEVLTSLGFTGEALSPQLRAFFGITDHRKGVLVTEVHAPSDAHRAGLRAGDVIVRLNQTDIATPRGLALVLSQLINRKPIQVEVIRDRKSRFLMMPSTPPQP